MTQPIDRVDAEITAAAAAGTTPIFGSSGRRRRRNTSSAEKAGIVAVAVLGAAAAIALSDAAPTGTDWIDAVERATVVVLAVLAGERARRWTLVLGAGLTSAFAVGELRIGAILALGIAMGLVLSDRRNRVLDSLIGGLVALAAMALDVGGPAGLETIVGLVAVVPILYSAYGYTTKRARRRWRRAAIAVVSLAAVATLVAAAATGLSVRRIEQGVASTRSGVAEAGNGDTAAAAVEFREAASSFRAADRLAGAWWAGAARAVPVVGANVSAVQDSVHLGSELTDSATQVAAQVDFESVQLPDGGVDVETLASFEPPIRAASNETDQAASTLSTMTSPWIVGPLASRVTQLSDEVADLQDQTSLALLGVEQAPTMLGADGPRRYLVLLANPAELRDLGGHLGNWAELEVDDGQIDLVDVGGPLELATPLEDAPKWVRDDLPPSFDALKPTLFPQNWGGTPDMATTTRLASTLFEQSTGRAVDGVVYADTDAFAAFLELSGPVAVPDLPEPFDLTAENAEQFLTRDQFTAFERQSVGDEALIEVIETMFERLTSEKLAAPDALGSLFAPLAAAGHLQFSTVHPDDDPFIDRLGVAGVVPDPDGGDLLSVLQRNAAPNKIDSYLSRETEVAIQWDPETGDVRSVVDVELRNDAPSEGLNELVLGNDGGAPYGSNVTDLAVITPFPLLSVEVDGEQVPAQPQLEGDLWRHTVRVVVPPGGTTAVSFQLIGQVDPGPTYRMLFVGQPIMGDNSVSVDLESVIGGSQGEGSALVGGTPRSGVDAGADHVLRWHPANEVQLGGRVGE